MHELSVTQNILDIALKEAENNGAIKITAIYLVIGEFSGIVTDSVRFYFDFISKETKAEGATLHFSHIPTRFKCHSCGTEFTPEEQNWDCPQCGSVGGKIVAGREFYIDTLEVE